jgi:flavin reductase (DIM6/NTAB) family NADH-FMN oxidoreductase RutF
MWRVGLPGTVAGTTDRSPPPPEAGLVARTDYPLYVVAASDGAEQSGCLAGFVTQCSIQPARFLVCLSLENHTFRVALEAGALSLHLLGSGQHDVASLFAELTGDTVDKFARCAWHAGATGAPVLDQCAAYLEGTVVDRVEVGDHVAFVVAPVAGAEGPAPGLFTWRDGSDLTPAHPVPSDDGPTRP